MKNFFAGFLVGDCLPMNFLLKPLLSFSFRFYPAYVFFQSGLSKVDDKFMVTSQTMSLFESYYNVPVLPYKFAAYLATYAELILPILLVLGFLTRPAALGLFILNLVAAISYSQTGDDVAAGHWQHILWGTMLAAVFVFGPSKVSIDQWISDKLLGERASLFINIILIAVLSVIGYFILTKYLGMAPLSLFK